MILNSDYFDKKIEINNDKGINVIEISDKQIFNTILKSLYNATYYDIEDNIVSINEYNGKLNLEKNCLLMMEYYNLDINNRKNLTKLYKYIISYNSDKEDSVQSVHKKILELNKELRKLFYDFEFNLCYNEDAGLNELFSLFKLKIEEKETNTLLDNIILYLDLIQELQLYKVIIFVNIKNYLSMNEVVELYKHIMNNNINTLFLNSLVFSKTLEYENKLILEDSDTDFEIIDFI